MPFTVNDFEDLLRLLRERPEWRAELRRIVLTDELLELPALMRELTQRVNDLAEAQRRAEERLSGVEERLRRAEERLERLEEAVAALAEAQRRAEERLSGVEERLRRAEERLERLEEAVVALAEAQRRTEAVLQALVRRVDRLDTQLGDLRGDVLEIRYRERAPAYLRTVVRRPVPLSRVALMDLLDTAEATGQLTRAETDDVALADLVLEGRRIEDGEPVYVVMEVSALIEVKDVERTARRARVLSKVRPALPAVAGDRVALRARQRAAAQGVWIVEDGRVTAPTP